MRNSTSANIPSREQVINGLEVLPCLDQALVLSRYVLNLNIETSSAELGLTPEEVEAKARQALMQLKNNVFHK